MNQEMVEKYLKKIYKFEEIKDLEILFVSKE
jgi:hypothetical protein